MYKVKGVTSDKYPTEDYNITHFPSSSGAI